LPGDEVWKSGWQPDFHIAKLWESAVPGPQIPSHHHSGKAGGLAYWVRPQGNLINIDHWALSGQHWS
jgi:hypothetical protein